MFKKIIGRSDASVANLAIEGNGVEEKPLHVKTGSKKCLTTSNTGNKVFKSKMSGQSQQHIQCMARYLCNQCD